MMVSAYYVSVIKNEVGLYVLTWKYPQDMLLNKKKNPVAEQHSLIVFILKITPTKLCTYIYMSIDT